MGENVIVDAIEKGVKEIVEALGSLETAIEALEKTVTDAIESVPDDVGGQISIHSPELGELQDLLERIAAAVERAPEATKPRKAAKGPKAKKAARRTSRK